MNHIAEEMLGILNNDEYLAHYGMPRRSGRYPWGSGKDSYQRGQDFLARVEELKKQGWKATAENIMEEFGLNTTEYRNEISWANYDRRVLQVERAKSLKADGKSATEIGREMGVRESTVRSWLDPKSEERMRAAKETADFLKARVDEHEHGMIDVGSDIELELGITRTRLDKALYALEREGYHVYSGGIPQITNPGQQTIQKVLCRPEVPHKDIYQYDKIGTLHEYTSYDGGDTFEKFQYPKSMDSKRLMIRYADDKGPDGFTGDQKDGIVELRRGVKDLSLGDSRYSQVRILVDDKKYIKGMAVYSDDLPDGVDVVFNTNKSKNVAKMDVLKDIKDDPDNPFGSLIKAQSTYIDDDGNKQLSLINKRADQGDWTDWKDTLPSQFLGKQSTAMAKKQLNLAKADKLAEYEDICALNNPTIKKHLLDKFADNCDSAAVHLKAAALPGQKYHVIIPINSLSDREVYAPQYKDGTKLALIRYPHGGTFEIPILTVNNKNASANKIIGRDSIDGIGINKKIADRLSGADFDGDTVMAIPTHDSSGRVKITSTRALKGLEGFDPKLEYGSHEIKVDEKGNKHYYRNGAEYPIMKNTNTQMGVISNLITDMTLAGATEDELARAVRHSMVVIDAEKHKLDYRTSEIENNISSLKKKYQIRIDENGKEHVGGASTLLSRSKGEYRVEKRQGTPKVNMKDKSYYDPSKPEGALIYKPADDLYYPAIKTNKKTGVRTITTVDGQKITYNVADKEAADRYRPVKKTNKETGEVTYTDKTGTISYKLNKHMEKSTNMKETDDAYKLVSAARHPMEMIYADYANSMKSLANQARKEKMSTGKIKYDAAAKEKYAPQVASLTRKLNDALLNHTRERAAQRLANAEVDAKKKANDAMSKEDIKKAGQQAIEKYRNSVGSIARRDRAIDITDDEWEAIQAGAISETKLKQILDNTDIDKLRERATPKTTKSLSTTKINGIKAMAASNYTIQQIAEKYNVSPSVVYEYLKGVN